MHELECAPGADCPVKFQWQAPNGPVENSFNQLWFQRMSARAECMIGGIEFSSAFWYPGETQATLLSDRADAVDQVVDVDDACKAVVGSRHCQPDTCPTQAVRWSLAGGPAEPAGRFRENEFSDTEAWAISGDGRVIAVNHNTPQGMDKAYWVDADGTVSLMGHGANFVTALSADGTFAAGSVLSTNGEGRAAIWSRDEYWIATPPDGWTLYSVQELSPDGEIGFGIATGVAQNGPGNRFRLFLWRRGEDIEIIPGHDTVLEVSGATSSGDTVVVAVSKSDLSTGPARWRRNVGWDDLTSEFFAGHLNVPEGIVLNDARISADGRTYMGNGTLANGQHAIWRADYRE